MKIEFLIRLLIFIIGLTLGAIFGYEIRRIKTNLFIDIAIRELEKKKEAYFKRLGESEEELKSKLREYKKETKLE